MLPDTSRVKAVLRITIRGCDDANEFDMAMTEDEAAFMQRLAEASAASSEYGCQPVLRFFARALDSGAA